MRSETLEDAWARIEVAGEKHGKFLREVELFVYRLVAGMLKGFRKKDAFVMQLPRPKDSVVVKGRPRLLAGEIVEGVRSALDYVVFALSERNCPTADLKHTKFVIADDAISYRRQAGSALKYLEGPERAFLEAVQPFATNNNMLSLLRDASNAAKHRKLLQVENRSNLEIVFGDLEKRDEYQGWWCYPQGKGAAVYARGVLRVTMLEKYEAAGLLLGMVETGSKVVAAFDQYLAEGVFPAVISE